MDADGELDSRRASELQRHLVSCWSCRSRAQEMERAIADYVRLQQEMSPQLPNIEGPHALLRARLAVYAAQTPRISRRGLFVRCSLLTASLVAVLVLGVWLPKVSHFSMRQNSSDAYLIPDSRLTPGAVIAFTKERDVCAIEPPKERFISAALGEKVFKEYGISHPRPRTYEVDYLIDPELGGSDDIQNLWPEPYSATWNARVKDALEDRLHELVCSGDLSLSMAQQEIAANWIAAYKKYFKTDLPLPAHFAFVKDPPWQ
jgi:hypothetical protein